MTTAIINNTPAIFGQGPRRKMASIKSLDRDNKINIGLWKMAAALVEA